MPVTSGGLMTRGAILAVGLGLFLAAALTSAQQAAPSPPWQGREGGPAGAGGPGGPRGRGNGRRACGPGREQVEAACTGCHGLNLIANSWGYTKEGWKDRIATMAVLPDAQVETISAYLAASYPVKP